MRKVVLLGLCAIVVAGCGGGGSLGGGGGVGGSVSKYTVRDIGPIGFPDSTANFKVNGTGQVAGVTREDFFTRSFFWNNGSRTYISGAVAEVYDINDSGQVVGSNGIQAFVWKNNTITWLATPEDDTSCAYGISSDGKKVVGSINSNSGGSTATLWDDKNGDGSWTSNEITSIGQGKAYAINDSGQVAVLTNSHAAIWKNNSLTDLGSPMGSSYARGINNSGVIVGDYNLGSACIWQNGSIVNLDMLGDNTLGKAYGINNARQVVGQISGEAVLWQDGHAYKLKDLIPAGSGWRLFEARDINESGQIVGYGEFNGTHHAFLLTPK